MNDFQKEIDVARQKLETERATLAELESELTQTRQQFGKVEEAAGQDLSNAPLARLGTLAIAAAKAQNELAGLRLVVEELERRVSLQQKRVGIAQQALRNAEGALILAERFQHEDRIAALFAEVEAETASLKRIADEFTRTTGQMGSLSYPLADLERWCYVIQKRHSERV